MNLIDNLENEIFQQRNRNVVGGHRARPVLGHAGRESPLRGRRKDARGGGGGPREVVRVQQRERELQVRGDCGVHSGGPRRGRRDAA